MPYMMGKKMIAPEPNTNPNGRPPVPAPFTREKHAMNAPTINPRIAYVTKPTMNADLGPMRLTVAIVFLLPSLARMLTEGGRITKGYPQSGQPEYVTNHRTKNKLIGKLLPSNELRRLPPFCFRIFAPLAVTEDGRENSAATEFCAVVWNRGGRSTKGAAGATRT